MRSKNVDIGDLHMTNGTAKLISLYIASAIGMTKWQWHWQWQWQSHRRRWRRNKRIYRWYWMYWTLKVQMALKVLTMTRVQMNGMANKAVTQTSWHGMEWTEWCFCSFMRYNNSTACLRIQAWNVDIHHRHNLLWQNPHDDEGTWTLNSRTLMALVSLSLGLHFSRLAWLINKDFPTPSFRFGNDVWRFNWYNSLGISLFQVGITLWQ